MRTKQNGHVPNKCINKSSLPASFTRIECAQDSPLPASMSPFSACPICNKRFTASFLPLHASSCRLGATKTKFKPRSNSISKLLTPRYALHPPSNASPSERIVPGFHIFPDVFTHVESKLLQTVHSTPPVWSDYRFRLSKNYGPQYDLSIRRYLVGPSDPKPLPLPRYALETVLPILRKLHPKLHDFNPNQLAVSKYAKDDSHILPHNDCENGHIRTAVVGVCLGGHCTMTLTLRGKESGLGKDVKRDVRLPKGAVYIMSDDSLRVWYHAIFKGNTDGHRVSLTFRDVEPHRPEQAAKWQKRRRSIVARKKKFTTRLQRE